MADRVDSEQEFGCEPGACVDFTQCSNLKWVLSAIRLHLSTESHTAALFVQVAQDSYNALPEDIQQFCDPPSAAQFACFIRYHWPTFIAARRQRDLIWGQVYKGSHAPNVIHVLVDLVMAAEGAAADAETKKSHHNFQSPTNLSLAQYDLLLVVVILHELMHAYNRHCIGENITPRNVGPDDGDNGESGWAFEKLLMGGIMGVEWNGELGTVGLIERINILYLQGSEGLRLIDHDAAQLMISSLGQNHHLLKSPQFASLKDHPSELQQGALRGRLFPLSEKAHRTTSNIPPPIGLGMTFDCNPPDTGAFRSLVGGHCRG